MPLLNGFTRTVSRMVDRAYLASRIRKIPNWPQPGILFYDLTTLFEDAQAFRIVIDALCEPYYGQHVQKVVGIDARGFILASAIAYKLHAGVVLVRKKGKLPGDTLSVSYEKEYGPDTLEMHRGAICASERVILIDDLIATGGSAAAALQLMQQSQAAVLGASCIVHLSFLPGMHVLSAYQCPVHSLISYDSEHTS